MAKIAIDIALLLPEAINKICTGVNQAEGSDAFSDLSKPDNYPHITLALGIIDEKDIEEVNSKLHKIVQQFTKLHLQVTNLSCSMMPDKKRSSCHFWIG